MKKVLAIVLCIAMMLALGVTAFAAEPTNLKFMMWGGFPAEGMDFQSLLYDTDPAFADKVTVETIIGGANGGEMLSKLRLEIAAGNAPDIVQMNASMVPEFAAEGLLADLTDAMAPYKDDIMEGAWNLSMYEGKNVGVPFQVNSKIMLYNKEMFDAAGIDVNAINNEDDFIEAGKKLQAVYPDSFITTLGTALQGYNLGTIISGNGGRFFDENGDYIVDTDEGVRAAFEMMKKVVDSGVVARINEWTPDWEQAFNDGTLAACLTGAWMTHFLNTYLDETHEGKWALAQFPVLAGSDGGSEDGGAVYVVMNDSKNKDLAIETLVNSMLSKEGQMVYFRALADTPYLKSLSDNEELNAPDPYWGEYMPEMLKSIERIKVFDFSPYYSTEIGIVIEYLDKCLNGELTVDEALAGAQDDLVSQIGNAFD